MTTLEVANRLIELCRTADYRKAQDELYAAHAVSIEPEGSFWQSAEGIENLNAKIDQWDQMVQEIHELQVSEPQIAGNFFSVRMLFDLTNPMGRMKGEQIAVYEVNDGKIVCEHFFYTPPPAPQLPPHNPTKNP